MGAVLAELLAAKRGMSRSTMRLPKLQSAHRGAYRDQSQSRKKGNTKSKEQNTICRLSVDTHRVVTEYGRKPLNSISEDVNEIVRFSILNSSLACVLKTVTV
ncbi:hypothetical protein KCU93_g290, partial [Aureobasidium melanogenum]